MGISKKAIIDDGLGITDINDLYKQSPEYVDVSLHDKHLTIIVSPEIPAPIERALSGNKRQILPPEQEASPGKKVRGIAKTVQFENTNDAIDPVWKSKHRDKEAMHFSESSNKYQGVQGICLYGDDYKERCAIAVSTMIGPLKPNLKMTAPLFPVKKNTELESMEGDIELEVKKQLAHSKIEFNDNVCQAIQKYLINSVYEACIDTDDLEIADKYKLLTLKGYTFLEQLMQVQKKYAAGVITDTDLTCYFELKTSGYLASSLRSNITPNHAHRLEQKVTKQYRLQSEQLAKKIKTDTTWSRYMKHTTKCKEILLDKRIEKDLDFQCQRAKLWQETTKTMDEQASNVTTSMLVAAYANYLYYNFCVWLQSVIPNCCSKNPISQSSAAFHGKQPGMPSLSAMPVAAVPA